jgi:hypothetical protein
MDINGPYDSLEDTFKVLLKQYILYFEATYISSRDKKTLLTQFMEDYNNFQGSSSEINNILNSNWVSQPHDDLVHRALQVGIFRMIKNYNPVLDQFYHFIEDNNKSMVYFFTSIIAKIQNQKIEPVSVN